MNDSYFDWRAKDKLHMHNRAEEGERIVLQLIQQKGNVW
jgi:hypothetical protein